MLKAFLQVLKTYPLSFTPLLLERKKLKSWFVQVCNPTNTCGKYLGSPPPINFHNPEEATPVFEAKDMNQGT